MNKFYIPLIFFIVLTYSVSGQNQLGQTLEGKYFYGNFGYSTDISSDGNRVAIACPFYSDSLNNEFLFAEVYEFQAGNWIRLGDSILIPSNRYSGYFSPADFMVIKLSGDGERIAIGGPHIEDSTGAGIGGINIYDWDGSTWNLTGSRFLGDSLRQNFGAVFSLSEDGNRLAVSLRYNDSTVSNGHQVKVFDWNGSAWQQAGLEILYPTNNSSWYQSHGAIELSPDGQRLAVGLPHEDYLNLDYNGSVYVYEWQGGNWVSLGSRIRGKHIFDGMGTSLSMSANGNILAIGGEYSNANGTRSGITEVYQWSGSNWIQMGDSLVGDFRREHFGTSVDLTDDGEFLAVGAYDGLVNNWQHKGHVRFFDWSGNAWVELSQRIEGVREYDSTGFSIAMSNNGRRIVVGSPHTYDTSNPFWRRIGSAKVYGLNQVYTGYVRRDTNNNCKADSLEEGMGSVGVLIEKNGYQLLTSTTSSGAYSVFLDTGSYTFSIDTGPYLYFDACPDTQHFSITTNTTTSRSPDFVLQDSISCPYMTVELTTIRIRRCFPGTYLLNYCNYGSEDATGAYVEVELDPNLTFVSTDGILLSQNGQLLRFDLGTVEIGECGQIRIDFQENCTSALGDITCSSAHIYPDTICNPNTPNTLVESTCIQDSLAFKVKNLGGLPNSFPFAIGRNGALLDSGSITLGTNDSILIYPSSFDSLQNYQFVLAPNQPSYYNATAAISCGGGGVTNMAFPAHSANDYQDTECVPNIGSYDPNDKNADPPAGNISPDVPLTYTIRFQNTGTDTAFFINILDTLSQHLDGNTVKVYASSHPFVYEVISQNPHVIRFKFDPILLPDSTTDLEGSNGFIKFGIQMNPGLPLGTTIENSAAIYFDFNEPIITNTVVHTLALNTLCTTSKHQDLINSCGPITWVDGKTYASSTNEPSYTLYDANGCDSVVNLNLFITQIDTAVSRDEFTLTAMEEGATYQWVDCSNNFSPIPAATQRSYTVPEGISDVAVIIRKNDCEEMSGCFNIVNVSAGRKLNEQAISVYPNPTDGKLSIDFGEYSGKASADLYDLMGKRIWSREFQVKNEITLDLNVPKGVYFLEVKSANGQKFKSKVILQ
ncbi:MAG: T9SS type A sorting domain-containing protein [Bacteroidia bacterium]|nr:T9SS type A sorting domain-containing protein [Bacteroidia bacterium]